MKNITLLIVLVVLSTTLVYGQTKFQKQKQDIYTLIAQYQQAREKMDTVLLKNILTDDVDQLVSSGEWRNGIRQSIEGMLRSSTSNTSARTLTVEKVRFFNSSNAIADARYEIQAPDGTVRKMWSTFITVYDKDKWRISAIRNMLPTGP